MPIPTPSTPIATIQKTLATANLGNQSKIFSYVTAAVYCSYGKLLLMLTVFRSTNTHNPTANDGIHINDIRVIKLEVIEKP